MFAGADCLPAILNAGVIGFPTLLAPSGWCIAYVILT